MGDARIRVLGAAFAAVPGSSPHETSMRALMDGLQCELDLITLKTERLSHIERFANARMLRVPVGEGDLAASQERYIRAVTRQLEAERYHVVHVLDPFAGLAALDRRQRGDRSRLVYEPLTASGNEPLARWQTAHEAVLRGVDHIWVSTRAAEIALRQRGIAGVDVVAPGVDVGRFDWSEAPINAPPRLLYLGDLRPGRDVDCLLEALRRIAEHRPIRALLAGDRDPDRRAAMWERVRRTGLEGTVDVRGEPELRLLPHLIAAADLCVAPAAAEDPADRAGLPQPLLEYLACFRPVVAADVPGVREWIEDEAHALLYPPGDAAALADAVLEMLRDAVLRERLTQAGYQRVRDDLNSGAHRRRVRQLYEKLEPGSQQLDAWAEPFEDSLGGGDLSEYTLERLATEPPEPETDATPLPRSDTPIAVDTHPALRLPDIDPGQG